jgi:hypothetical protein
MRKKHFAAICSNVSQVVMFELQIALHCCYADFFFVGRLLGSAKYFTLIFVFMLVPNQNRFSRTEVVCA